MKDILRLDRINLFNSGNHIMTLTHPLNLSRTGEALAVAELYSLHSVGEHELADVPCGMGREGRRRGRTKDAEGKGEE